MFWAFDGIAVLHTGDHGAQVVPLSGPWISRSAVCIVDLSTLGLTPDPRVSLQRSVDPFPGDGGRQAEDRA